MTVFSYFGEKYSKSHTGFKRVGKHTEGICMVVDRGSGMELQHGLLSLTKIQISQPCNLCELEFLHLKNRMILIPVSQCFCDN